MASAAQNTPETPVTVKVNIDGVARRFKLPLRDVGINVLEPKVRRDPRSGIARVSAPPMSCTLLGFRTLLTANKSCGLLWASPPTPKPSLSGTPTQPRPT